jgi:hypothetical protein
MTEPKKNCKDCKHFMLRTYQCVKSTPWETDTHLSCKDFEQKPKTNRDVINAMTDEELAKWADLLPCFKRDPNGFCRIYWQNPKPCKPQLNCIDCRAAWLKAPAGKHQEV